MAGTSLTVDEKLEALERKFMDMMENMNAAFDKLSREVESNRTGSVPRPPPRHIPPPQNVAPQRVPPDEEEAENEFDDSDDVEERFQPGPNRRPNIGGLIGGMIGGIGGLMVEVHLMIGVRIMTGGVTVDMVMLMVI